MSYRVTNPQDLQENVRAYQTCLAKLPVLYLQLERRLQDAAPEALAEWENLGLCEIVEHLRDIRGPEWMDSQPDLKRAFEDVEECRGQAWALADELRLAAEAAGLDSTPLTDGVSGTADQHREATRLAERLDAIAEMQLRGEDERPRIEGSNSSDKRDVTDDLLPAEHYVATYGLTAEQLRKAAMRGRLKRSVKSDNGRWYHSEAEVKHIWKHELLS